MNKGKLFFTRTIKSLASVAKTRVGLPPSPASGTVNIIAYHRVVADIVKAEREAIYGLVVSAETFRRHCEMLKSSFEVVSLEAARDALENRRQAEKPLAVITFDDGYLDFYTVAFPILRALDLPAVNFLPTEFVGKGKLLAHDRIFWLFKLATENRISIRAALHRAGIENKIIAEIADTSNLLSVTDALVFLPHEQREKVIGELEHELGENFVEYPIEYQPLDWAMVNEMAREKIDFGYHTANHVVLTLETDAAFETEITAGKRELERHLNKKAVTFAYPNGQYDERVKKNIAAAGFEIAVTTERKINRAGESDLLALGRFSLCEESTRGVKGVYSPAVAGLRLNI